MEIRKFILSVLAITALISPLHASWTERRASINGKEGDQGKCTIEVDVDGSAQVEISGERGRLRTLSGQPSEWRRFECTGPLPQNPVDFRFRGIDGRGKVQLLQDPRYNRGIAVIGIDDPKRGREGYTFDLEWRGASGGGKEFYVGRGNTTVWNDNDSSSLVIVRASYGLEDRHRDVTSSLQTMVRDGRLEFRVSNASLGMDPAPGREKELRLTYEYRGHRKDVVVREGEWLRLPEWHNNGEQWNNQRNLRIIHAVYGVPGQNSDVTSSLQEMVWEDRLDFRVNNGAFQMDPAPNRRKELQITYEHNGRTQSMSVREGDRCIIP